MRFFIAGVMQGSRSGKEIASQEYRKEIKAVLRKHFPQAEIVCPWELHPDSVDYGPEEGRRTFLEMNEEATKADVLIAYVPEASMGTAIEMWQAYQAGRVILTISPLTENWVVKFLSHRVFPSIKAFAAFIERGGLEKLLSPKS